MSAPRLLELARGGRAPAAIITSTLAPVVVLGSVIAEALYGARIPVILVSAERMIELADGERLSISLDGTLRLSVPSE